MSETEDRLPQAVPNELVDVLTVRDAVLDALLEKIDTDRYPSATMMNDVERILTPQRRQDYAEILLNKVREDRFPSRALIQRLIKLSG